MRWLLVSIVSDLSVHEGCVFPVCFLIPKYTPARRTGPWGLSSSRGLFVVGALVGWRRKGGGRCAKWCGGGIEVGGNKETWGRWGGGCRGVAKHWFPCRGAYSWAQGPKVFLIANNNIWRVEFAAIPMFSSCFCFVYVCLLMLLGELSVVREVLMLPFNHVSMNFGVFYPFSGHVKYQCMLSFVVE